MTRWETLYHDDKRIPTVPITVCGALNWIDRTAFLPEAHRLLVPRGWVVIYDNTIQGSMADEPAFAPWYTGQFLHLYPKPPRDERPLTPEECRVCGFSFVHQESYTNLVPFTLRQFVAYLLTQSNIVAAVEQGRASYKGAQEWLAAALVVQRFRLCPEQLPTATTPSAGGPSGVGAAWHTGPAAVGRRCRRRCWIRRGAPCACRE